MLLELLGVLEKPDAQAFAPLVVLRDERAVEGCGRCAQMPPSDGQHRARCPDSVSPQDEVLPKLAHLQLEGAQPVDDSTAVGLQPVQELASQLHRVDVTPGVRGRADAVHPDALGRRCRRVDDPLVHMHEADPEALPLECLPKGRNPGNILVEDIYCR